MHFGLHLLRKRAISVGQFIDALEVCLRETVPLDQLAIEQGAMSVPEVFTVLRAQVDAPAERFGDTARRLGMLTDDVLARLLMLQADSRRSFAEILVEQQATTLERVQRELAEFRRLQQRLGPHRRQEVRRIQPLQHRVPVLPAESEAGTSRRPHEPKPIPRETIRRAR